MTPQLEMARGPPPGERRVITTTPRESKIAGRYTPGIGRQPRAQ